MYRTTPHSTTNTPPCELLMGRHLRTRLDLLRPDTRKKVFLSKNKDMMNAVVTVSSTKVMLSGLEISVVTLTSGSQEFWWRG